MHAVFPLIDAHGRKKNVRKEAVKETQMLKLRSADTRLIQTLHDIRQKSFDFPKPVTTLVSTWMPVWMHSRADVLVSPGFSEQGEV